MVQKSLQVLNMLLHLGSQDEKQDIDRYSKSV